MMNLTRFKAAPAYHPPNHQGMHCLRLQGHEAGPADALWLGISHLLPGGGTTLDASQQEKFYVVLDGSVTVVTEAGEETLTRYDSCRLAPNEKRALANRTNLPATILLAMPYPRGEVAVQEVLAASEEAALVIAAAADPDPSMLRVAPVTDPTSDKAK